jgi:hypothetical protein
MTIEVQPVVAFDDAVEIQMTNSVISRTGISASQRRRSILLLLAVVGHCAIRRAARRCVIYNSLRLTFSFEAHSALLSDRRFKRMYRLSRHDFCGITDLVVANRIACGSPKVRVPVESRLSMTLRYLAGGSYLDIAISHCVSISTFYFVVDEMLVDLDESLSIKFPFRSAEWLERSSIGFSRDRSPLRGCVGALDGIAIKIYEPSAADAANPSTYYNRKGFLHCASKQSAILTTRLRLYPRSVRVRLMTRLPLPPRASRVYCLVARMNLWPEGTGLPPTTRTAVAIVS